MPSRTMDYKAVLAIAAMAALAACAGCASNRVQASAPVATAPLPDAERPMNVAPDTDAQPPQAAAPAPPALSAEIAAPSLNSIPKMQLPPAPPRPPVEHAAERETASAGHAPAPQVVPKLSPADQVTYERKATDDLNVAVNNLNQANGRQLNGTQQDLVDKIRGFLKQSRDASKSGDWARAQNLAEKARLLSIELVSSL
ncbi:MAG TPA: hypothetical protein VJR26_07630 [Candidatus Acidoferrales bacterium]|nr:hypothetical protein [Candidatus Acidoferrales bacterium]